VNEAAEPRREYLQFTGSASEYFRIWIVNTLLTIATLGVYSAWAKVRRNRYIYGNVGLGQGRFDYHAKPAAILRGRAIAVFLLLAFLVAQALVPEFLPLTATLVAVTVPWLIVRSRMFNMYNTSYRNIRFGFLPAYWDSFRVFFFAGLLTVATVGIATPVAHYLRNRFIVRNTRYGNFAFSTHGAIWDFFYAYFVTFVASSIIVIPLLNMVFGLTRGAPLISAEGLGTLQWVLPIISGLATYYIVTQFLSAATLRPTIESMLLDCAGMDEVRFGCKWNLNHLLMIFLSNFIAIVLSLGGLAPWAKMRVVRYLINGIWVESSGGLDAVVARSGAEVSAIGEEIGSAFDVDIGL
jgi:uncharacterized membrane protein YjgN (DUF898 family)